MVGHGGSSAGSYLADPTSPIPSHCASIVATSTLRVKVFCHSVGVRCSLVLLSCLQKSAPILVVALVVSLLLLQHRTRLPLLSPGHDDHKPVPGRGWNLPNHDQWTQLRGNVNVVIISCVPRSVMSDLIYFCACSIYFAVTCIFIGFRNIFLRVEGNSWNAPQPRCASDIMI